MDHARSAAIFDSLTEKQHEALALAARGMTSKEIARELGISPHSVDKRIDTVRSQLGHMPRTQLARAYRHWDTGYETVTGDPFPLPPVTGDRAPRASQPEGETLPFHDSLAYGMQEDWEQEHPWLHRGVKPSDLGVGARLMLVFVGAFFIAATFVLVAASSNVLADLLS